MTLGDILTAAKKLGTKAETSLGSLLSSAEKKVATGTKTVGDLLNAASSPVNGKASSTIPGIAANTVAGIPKAALGVAKDIAHGAATFAMSAGEAIPEIPLEAYSLATGGKGPQIPAYEPKAIPGLGFLGPVESYQNKAKKAVASGESPLMAILKGGASAVTDEPTGVALKPLALAGHALAPAIGAFIKGGGAKSAEEAIDALVKATSPEEVHSVLEGLGFNKTRAAKIAPALAEADTPEKVADIITGKKTPEPVARQETAANDTPVEKGTDGPARLYHGTLENFDTFDPGKAGSNSGWDNAKFGTFFTDSADTAKEFPELTRMPGDDRPVNVKAADVHIKNPIDLTPEGIFNNEKQAPVIVKILGGDDMKPAEALEYLNDNIGLGEMGDLQEALYGDIANKKLIEDAGYDGIVSQYGQDAAGKTIKEYVAFHPDQIKMAGAEAAAADVSRGTESIDLTSDHVLDAEGDPIRQVGEKVETGAASHSKGPVDAVRFPDGEVMVLDGQHRANDALTAGKNTIEANFLSAADAIKKYGHMVDPDVLKDAVDPGTSVGSMKSIGDILKGGDGKVPPSVPHETATGPIPSGDPERRFITRVKSMAPDAQAMLDGKYKARDTKELIATADNLIAMAPEQAERLAIEGTDDNAVAVASRLIDTYINDAKAATGPAKDTLYEKAANIANAAAKTLTEHGRAVQAASILGKLTPEGMVRYAARQIQKYNEQAGERTVKNLLGLQKKIPELTGEQAKEISDAMEKIQGITDPEEKAKAFNDLSQKVRKLIPSTLYSKVIGLWKAGLLTGIKTSGLNIASNASHAIAETVKDIPAALVDKVASLFTGQRTLAATTRGIPSGTAEGIQKGWRFFRTGYDERDALEGLDFKQVNFGNGPVAKAAQAYEQTIFRLLGAEDQPFYYGAKARSLYSQAIAQGKNEGLKGAALGKRVNELVAAPTDQMLKYAVMDAQTAVFQNKTALGTAARAIQNLPGGEVLLPFGKTPAAVATQLINYTPVGIVKTVIENIGKGRFDQRLFSQGIGRGLTGTGVLAIGGALAAAGLITGSYPTSEKEQKQWQLEGKQANSIKIGDKWRGVGVLGPLGMVLSVGAALHNGIQNSGSFIGGLGEAAAAGGSALTQQSFLYGINQAINALNDPARYGATFINNTIGSIIPTIVADVARATDTNERQTNTATQRLVSRIPGLRELLQPQVDTLGSKIKTAPFLTVMADPTRPYEPTQAPNDPVVKELRRLDDAGYNVTPTMLGTKQGFKSLTGPENTDLWVKAGTAAKKAIADITQDSVYPSLDDEQKSKLVAKVVDDAETQARAQAVVDATKGLAGKALDDKIAEMVADKLVTKTVYKWYSALGGIGNYPITQ